MNKKLSLEELNRASVDEFKKIKKYPVKVLIDNIRSLNNVGSIFRTCDAFKVEELILYGITATPPHREINKTAIGATESVNWRVINDIASEIMLWKSQGYIIASIEQTKNSSSLESISFRDDSKYVFVLGNEVSGVSQQIVDLSDVVIEIPQFGTKHSLNVTIAGGIILWKFIESRLN